MNLEDRVRILENDMMLVKDGSLVEHISEAWHWKNTPEVLAGGTDYTADGAWTGLDLNKWTSNKAKYVILQLVHLNTCTANDNLQVRKNGSTETTYAPTVKAQVNSQVVMGGWLCPCDGTQNIEYYATDASDTRIEIWGYIE